jgi:hypothetical protein
MAALLMTLDEARAELARGPQPGLAGYQRNSVAALTVYYNDARSRGRKLTYDGAPQVVRRGPMVDRPGPGPHRHRDQAPRVAIPSEIEQGRSFDPTLSYGKLRSAERGGTSTVETASVGSEIGATVQRSDGPNNVGGRLIQTLPGDLSAYYLATDYATGRAGLFYIDRPKIDAGMVVGSTGVMRNTMDRDPAYYRRLAQQAAVQRELTGAVLKDINRRNREAWSNRSG